MLNLCTMNAVTVSLGNFKVCGLCPGSQVCPAAPERLSRSYLKILLQDLDLQIIERDLFYEIVSVKTAPAVLPEVAHILIQPDRLRQIKLTADTRQGMEHLVRPRVL